MSEQKLTICWGAVRVRSTASGSQATPHGEKLFGQRCNLMHMYSLTGSDLMAVSGQGYIINKHQAVID